MTVLDDVTILDDLTILEDVTILDDWMIERLNCGIVDRFALHRGTFGSCFFCIDAKKMQTN